MRIQKKMMERLRRVWGKSAVVRIGLVLLVCLAPFVLLLAFAALGMGKLGANLCAWAIAIGAMVAFADLMIKGLKKRRFDPARHRCPSCKQFNAFFVTDRQSRLRGGRLWRCDHCGFEEWRDDQTRSGDLVHSPAAGASFPRHTTNNGAGDGATRQQRERCSSSGAPDPLVTQGVSEMERSLPPDVEQLVQDLQPERTLSARKGAAKRLGRLSVAICEL